MELVVNSVRMETVKIILLKFKTEKECYHFPSYCYWIQKCQFVIKFKSRSKCFRCYLDKHTNYALSIHTNFVIVVVVKTSKLNPNQNHSVPVLQLFILENRAYDILSKESPVRVLFSFLPPPSSQKKICFIFSRLNN